MARRCWSITISGDSSTSSSCSLSIRCVFFWQVSKFLYAILLRATAYPRTRHRLRHLCQVNLIVILLVTQAILVSVGKLVRVSNGHAFQLLNRSIPCHFEINADTTVERARRQVYVDIGYSGLDNLGQDLLRLLVVCDADLDGPPARQEGSNTTRQASLQRIRQFVKLVNLPPMFVLYLDSASGVGVSRVCLDYHAVQEIVEAFVLGL